MRHYSNLAIVRSVSKAYGLAGLGISYCIAHSGLAAEPPRIPSAPLIPTCQPQTGPCLRYPLA